MVPRTAIVKGGLCRAVRAAVATPAFGGGHVLASGLEEVDLDGGIESTQPGGVTVTQQIIPVSGSVPAGGTGSVLVPFFAPIPSTLLTGIIRVTFHIEGVLDDGSNVRTSEHEYIFVTCNTSGCNSACL